MIIKLYTQEHDRFVDFIKGLSIIGVILLHNVGHTSASSYLLFNLWIGMSVPLFILVQILNSYKKYDDVNRKIGFSIYGYYKRGLVKIIKRIFLPFLMLQFVIITCMIMMGKDLANIGNAVIEYGGYGPGSYFPWVYFQFFMLIPFAIYFNNRFGIITSFLFWGGISIMFEALCSLINCSEELYRLMAGRYIFLIGCGIYIIKYGIRLNTLIVLSSIIGVALIIVDSYSTIDLFPIAFKSYGFRGQHWFSYFYVSFALLFIMKFIQLKFEEYNVAKLVEHYGKDSYSIFIMQMALFWLLRIMHLESYDLSIKTITFCVISTVLPLLWSSFEYIQLRDNLKK